MISARMIITQENTHFAPGQTLFFVAASTPMLWLGRAERLNSSLVDSHVPPRIRYCRIASNQYLLRKQRIERHTGSEDNMVRSIKVFADQSIRRKAQVLDRDWKTTPLTSWGGPPTWSANRAEVQPGKPADGRFDPTGT